MSIYEEIAMERRSRLVPKYNCAQAVAAAFAKEAGIDEEMVLRFGAGFGGGMRRGSVCGAVTGGIMVLGLFGLSDPALLKEYQSKFFESHGEMYDCADLLRVNVGEGGKPKKEFCDGLICDSVHLVEEILREHGKLSSED